MGTVFTSGGQSATPVVIMGGGLTATITGISATLANGGGTVTASITNGLSATFFNAVTVNTTGSQALAANTGRQLGVWIQCDTASVQALVGDALNTAVVPIGNSTAATLLPHFIPGTGAIYVKAATAFVNYSGYWM